MGKVLTAVLVLLLFGCTAGKDDEQSVQTKSAETPLFDQDDCFMYHASQLREEEMETYKLLYEGFMNMKSPIYVNEKENNIEDLYRAVLMDHPEIFWVSDTINAPALDYKVRDDQLIVRPRYGFTLEEKDRYAQEINQKASEIVSDISQTASEYEKVKYIYDYVIDHTELEETAVNKENILSVFIEGNSYCNGYSRAVQFLLQKLNVDCSFIIGYGLEHYGHAWNMVNMEDEYYYIDAALGEAKEGYDKSYAYFGITSSEMKHYFQPKVSSENSYAIKNNYYVKEHLYFETIDHEALYALLANDEDRMITLKCSDPVLFDQMITYLFDDEQIHALMSEAGISNYSITYYRYDPQSVLTIMY